MKLSLIAVSASLVKTLPKNAIQIKAKSKIVVEDDKHESVIKRGEIFHIADTTKGYFLFDAEGEKFGKFSITKRAFNKYQKEHTVVVTNAPKNLKQRVTAKKPVRKKSGSSRISRVRSRVLDTIREFSDTKSNNILLTKVHSILTYIDKTFSVIEEYKRSDVDVSPMFMEYLRGFYTLVKKMNSRDISKRDVQILLINEFSKLQVRFKVDLSEDIDEFFQRLQYSSSMIPYKDSISIKEASND